MVGLDGEVLARSLADVVRDRMNLAVDGSPTPGLGQMGILPDIGPPSGA